MEMQEWTSVQGTRPDVVIQNTATSKTLEVNHNGYLLQVTGGSGSSGAGGGSGGRIAIYWSKRKWWYGQFLSFGGRASARGMGGAGTVYIQVIQLFQQIKQEVKVSYSLMS